MGAPKWKPPSFCSMLDRIVPPNARLIVKGEISSFPMGYILWLFHDNQGTVRNPESTHFLDSRQLFLSQTHSEQVCLSRLGSTSNFILSFTSPKNAGTKRQG